MKLVLFTPAIFASSIGRVSQLLEIELLRQGHEVAIVRTEDEPHLHAAPHLFAADLTPWNQTAQVEKLIQQADAAVYQVGNNYPYHRGCLEWLPKAPGIVCLHDYYVAHMFAMWAERNRTQAEAILRAWYGEHAVQRFFSHHNADEFIEETRTYAPMTEWIAAQATGVITHSSWDIQRVLRACPGPVQVVALSHFASSSHTPTSGGVTVGAPSHAPMTNDTARTYTFSSQASQGASHAATAEPFHVATIGHMNSNKRQASIIRALGRSDLLREVAHYELVGPIEPHFTERLQSLARQCGVQLSVAGEVDDAQMAEAIERADVLCCLRSPVLESASGSVIEGLLSGKATLVLDIGFYRELPDDYVCKVSPEREVEDAQHALEYLYTHPEERHALGAHAANWARETFSATRYAEELVRVSALATKVGPAMEASKLFADVLTRWGATEALISSPEVAAFLTPLGQPAWHRRQEEPRGEPAAPPQLSVVLSLNA